MKCFDPDCPQSADSEIRGTRMCLPHYIEALEYSAHITSFVAGNDHSIKVQMPIPKLLDKIPILR